MAAFLLTLKGSILIETCQRLLDLTDAFTRKDVTILRSDIFAVCLRQYLQRWARTTCIFQLKKNTKLEHNYHVTWCEKHSSHVWVVTLFSSHLEIYVTLRSWMQVHSLPVSFQVDQNLSWICWPKIPREIFCNWNVSPASQEYRFVAPVIFEFPIPLVSKPLVSSMILLGAEGLVANYFSLPVIPVSMVRASSMILPGAKRLFRNWFLYFNHCQSRSLVGPSGEFDDSLWCE